MPPPAENTHKDPSVRVAIGTRNGLLDGGLTVTAQVEGGTDGSEDDSGSGAGGGGIDGKALSAFLRALAEAARDELEGTRALKTAADMYREQFIANPDLVLAQLNEAEGAAAQSAPYLWRMFFGRALERIVARDPQVAALFRYVGQGPGADFILRATQSAYELTTSNPGTIAAHVARGIVDIGRTITYRAL
jgi:hypothetical protein